jgi:charged multivesicular body protein 4
MSVFQRLFGGSKKQDGNNITPAEAIQRLSSVEEMLNKKQEHLESQIELEKTNALRCSKQGNKRGALIALKRKKKHEKILLQLDGTLTTLEAQRESLQNASSNMEVLRVMRQAAGALKKSNQDIDADHLHELMDDLDEQHHLGNTCILLEIK